MAPGRPGADPRSSLESGSGSGSVHVVVANPGADVYGSDLQLLESVRALVGAGHRVTVMTPDLGPLVDRLRAVGGEVVRVRYPVLRRATMRPAGFVALLAALARDVPGMVGTLRRLRPAVLYVNTLTLPWWLALARAVRVPCLCHVHEAESNDPLLVRRGLSYPLHLATLAVANGQPALEAACDVAPGLRSRFRVVRNGVAGPPSDPEPRSTHRPVRLVVIGRLSARKGVDVALEVTAGLLARGRDVVLEVVGSVFPGNEAYEQTLRRRADEPDLSGRVRFTGYESPVWPVLDRNDIVLAPSLLESLGNAVVEAQLALRPVVATRQPGHTESVQDHETGYLVTVSDVGAMVRVVEEVLDHPSDVDEVVARARLTALDRFSTDRYDREIVAAVEDTVSGSGGR